jgi:hypothetical protein
MDYLLFLKDGNLPAVLGLFTRLSDSTMPCSQDGRSSRISHGTGLDGATRYRFCMETMSVHNSKMWPPKMGTSYAVYPAI